RAAPVVRQFYVGDLVVTLHASDTVAHRIGEPHRSIGARSEALRKATWIDLEPHDRAIGLNPPDTVALVLGVPDRAVLSAGDRVGRVSADRPPRSALWRRRRRRSFPASGGASCQGDRSYRDKDQMSQEP